MTALMKADEAARLEGIAEQGKFVVLKIPNGYAETLQPNIEIFTNETDASDKCEALALKYPGQVFGWFRQCGQSQPRKPIETVKFD